MKKVRKADPRDGWYEIGPLSAQELLDHQVKNRPLNEAEAARIAQSIDHGHWEPNGESMVLDQQGRLLDGQTRCRGVVLANRPIVVYVVHGVASKVFDSIDQGRARTGAHIAAILGVKNYALASSVASWALHYDGAWTMQHFRVPNRDIRTWLQKNGPELEQTIEEMSTVAPAVRGRKTIWLPSVSTFTYFMTRRVSPANAKTFLLGVATGESLAAGSPMLALRNRLSGERADRFHQMAWFVIAWNAFTAGRKVQLVKHVPKKGGAGKGLPRFGEEAE